MYNSDNFKIFAIDKQCQRIFDQACLKDPYCLPAESIFPTSIQGFCLCNKESKSPVAGFYCFPYIKKQKWKTERVLRINRPLVMQCNMEVKEEAVNALMHEIYEIGEKAGVDTLEVELYKEIGSEIFFPSTIHSVINNCA